MNDEIRQELRKSFVKVLNDTRFNSAEELDKAFNTYAKFEERLSNLDKEGR